MVRTFPQATPATGHIARAPATLASFPQQIATYPSDGQTRVPPGATLFIVFDQPTLKSGSFSVADLDSGGGVLLNLDAPQWSALGDTVFLKPSAPMTFGHHHGMRVNTIFATDGTASNDLPIVFFTVFPRALLERIPTGNNFSSLTLVPETPIPVGVSVRERNDNAVTFTSARVEFWPAANVTLSGGTPPSPLSSTVIPVAQQVPRLGSARLSVPVVLPRDLARTATAGALGLRVIYDGFDETGLPLSFEALSSLIVTPFADTLLAMAPALVTPLIASDVVVQSVFLEEPLPGAVHAAGDTVRARAVVTGIGTGPFRAVFYLDGAAVAIEEGYMESGRPVSIEPRGPIVSRRLGEHRLHVVVEAPQNVAARPITFLCVPPPAGLTELPRKAGADDSLSTAAPAPPRRFRVDGTYLAAAQSEFREERASAVGWSAWRMRYDLAKNGGLEANVLWRLRADDPENGSAIPEQVTARYRSERLAVEWGDLTPKLAAGAPLFASTVPRRAAQASWAGSPLGDLEGYIALESRPRSSGGPIDEIRSDLYAARLSRRFLADHVLAAVYGGYTHDDATPGGVESATRARAVYGGTGRWTFGKDWSLLGDVATVRHRTIEGVEPGRSRTGLRGELRGGFAGFSARVEAFRYQPDLATPLNPYAISDRRGGGAELARDLANWRFSGSYRREEPDEVVGVAPKIRVDRWSFGGRLTLNRVSFVTPAFIRIQHDGPNTKFRETRAATELVIGEKYEGQTRARIDLARFEDEQGVNQSRLVTSGSLVSTRRHAGRVTSTISGGVEKDEHDDLDLTDWTLQAAIELRWEALPGRFLIAPFASWLDREYDTLARTEEHLTVRLQVAWLRVPGLGDNALSLEGRINRIDLKDPIEDESTEGSVHLTFGQRFDLTARH